MLRIFIALNKILTKKLFMDKTTKKYRNPIYFLKYFQSVHYLNYFDRDCCASLPMTLSKHR